MMTRTHARVLHGFVDGSETAVRDLLESVGEKPNREGLLDTPRRAVEAWQEFLSTSGKELEDLVRRAVFELEEGESGHPGIVALKDIPFTCISQETLLPFYGTCHVAYKITENKILGLSKVARFVHAASRRIQTQKQFTECVAHVVQNVTNSQDIAVLTTAVHIYYDRPLKTRQSSFLSGTFRNSTEDAQELMVLLLVDENKKIETSVEEKVFDVVPDAVILEEMYRHVHSLFQGLSIVPEPEAIKNYSYQVYCATIGLRSSPSTYTANMETLKDSNEEKSDQQDASLASCVVDFVSLCEHHLLPFHGRVFIGCSTDSSTLSSIDVSRVVKPFLYQMAHQPQVQERLTNQIADHVKRQLSVSSVLVLCEAMHLCMIGRGPRTHQTATRTMCKRGDISLGILRKGNAALKEDIVK